MSQKDWKLIGVSVPEGYFMVENPMTGKATQLTDPEHPFAIAYQEFIKSNLRPRPMPPVAMSQWNVLDYRYSIAESGLTRCTVVVEERLPVSPQKEGFPKGDSGSEPVEGGS